MTLGNDTVAPVGRAHSRPCEWLSAEGEWSGSSAAASPRSGCYWVPGASSALSVHSWPSNLLGSLRQRAAPHGSGNGLNDCRVPFCPFEAALSPSLTGILGASESLTSLKHSSGQASGPRTGSRKDHRPTVFPGLHSCHSSPRSVSISLFPHFPHERFLSTSHFMFTKCLRPLTLQLPQAPGPRPLPLLDQQVRFTSRFPGCHVP